MAVIAGVAHGLRLDAPAFALSVGETPIDVFIDDHPDMSQHLQRVFHLVVTNSGRKPIAIQDVHASCDCTVAGEFSGEQIPSGGEAIIPLNLRFPAHGTRSTTLTLIANVKSVPHVEVPLRLHGPKVQVPALTSTFRPMQFVTSYAGELVEHEFEVTTIERRHEAPWLNGMSSSHRDVDVQLIASTVSEQLPQTDFARRQYRFLVRFVGPLSENEVLSFHLKPDPQKSVGNKLPAAQSIRCHLVNRSVAGTYEPKETTSTSITR